MCGIAGILGPQAENRDKEIKKMLEVQRHRGPDASGLKLYNRCALGHVRLSIIDLSRDSDQPMISESGRFALVYNGELYNYIELKMEMQALGIHFKTSGDAEVLLKCWELWGEKCLKKLIGMFSFAIWDHDMGNLCAVRDRFGIKPFYYAWNDRKELVFSSEIKALFAAGVSRNRNDRVWADYLLTGRSDHGVETFFKGIFRLMPGNILKYSQNDGVTTTPYWEMPVPFSDIGSFSDYEEACHELRTLILDSVSDHLRMDVDFGAFVSGGVDSALVLAGARQAGHASVRGFHFDYPGVYSEKIWVEDLVSEFGTVMDYHVPQIEDVVRQFESMAWYMEEPLGGIVSFALSPLYSSGVKSGIKVFLDGDGVDDFFGGYRSHHMAYLSSIMDGDSHLFETALNESAQFWGQSASVLKNQIEAVRNDCGSELNFDLSKSTMGEVVLPEISKDASDFVSKRPRSLDRLLMDGVTLTKIPKNTRYDDRISMAHSVELRVPFLDHRFAEFLSQIPSSYLFKGGKTKAIVRDAMKGLIPDRVLYATKREVQSAQREWFFKEPLVSFVKDILYSKKFSQRGFLNHKKTQDMFEFAGSHGIGNSFPLWQWINLEMWHRVFLDSNLEDVLKRPSIL